MDNERFERLLYEEESSTLDFKKEQYRFAKATEVEKSELLKDILGFANAWRRSGAYILIGVEDVRGGRANVIGIPAGDHLDDHSLQQFVNSLTNQPVRFHYEAFGFEGEQVGIISIDEQTRPIYLKRDYGRLKKEKVYVRRGSSTDPTKPASPEEISQVRIGEGRLAAELLVEFAHVERDDALGTNISWEAEFCEMPTPETIPDLSPPRQEHGSHALRKSFGIDIIDIIPTFQIETNHPNDDFFRELADFEFVRRLTRPVRLAVKNVGKVAANNVLVELTVPTNIGVMVASEMPDPPKRRVDRLSNPVLDGIRPAFRRYPGDVWIDRNDERFRIEINCGDLQPGRRIRSDVFYIAKEESGNLSLYGLVFADELPQPKELQLTISISVVTTEMTVAELRSLPWQQEMSNG